MWLTVGRGAIELLFEHTHDGRRHRHDLAVASVEAHQLAHRLERRQWRA
ncbi:MAG TPA: hypothetical protein VFR68_15140 [Candidatus Dormibacteraeota bacterium]|nr:hypothetical protein [Candidatus Dormibacteraeota bacterium]